MNILLALCAQQIIINNHTHVSEKTVLPLNLYKENETKLEIDRDQVCMHLQYMEKLDRMGAFEYYMDEYEQLKTKTTSIFIEENKRIIIDEINRT